MKILAIETSCDETSAAIIEGVNGTVRILSNIVGSQIKIHTRYGGVVPELAARRHAELIISVISEAFRTADAIEKNSSNLRSFYIDAVAVTYGPGLMVALLVGVEVAKSLSYAWNKPCIAVNHLEGHVYSVLAKRAEENTWSAFLAEPFISLVVSGGHTELLMVNGYGKYTVLGRTRDDAAGEAFDKVAKMIGLSYPGGPALAREAVSGNPSAFEMPRAMLESGDFDFSFAGIKTWVKNLLASRDKDTMPICDIAASFQEAVCDILVAKTIAAARRSNVERVVVTGGVSANDRLREKFGEAAAQTKIACYFPAKSLTGDNAGMIGIAGYLKYLHTKKFDDIFTIRPNPDLKWE